MYTLTAFAIGGLTTGAAGLVVAVLAHVRLARLRKEPAPPVREASPQPTGTIDPRAIRNVAMLRYDAFNDMGGRLSFSLALLDATGDGVVLTSINGHSETRTYAKVIRGGESTHDLSPEEEQVLSDARRGGPAAAGGDGQAGMNGVPGRKVRS